MCSTTRTPCSWARVSGVSTSTIDDRFAVLDAEPDSLVTGGVRDEEEGGGVRVAGVGQALSEFEDGEPLDRDAGEFHAAPNMTCAYL